MYEDGQVIRGKYNDVHFMTDLDLFQYIQERNKLLVRFLCGLSGLDYATDVNKVQFTFAKTLERVYYLRHFNLVLHVTFSGNMV